MKPASLLMVDATINLVLGVLLIIFPAWLVSLLGVPKAVPGFYAGILGGVLFGIGIALLVERFRGEGGLGLGGAVSINLCGGAVLAGWLLFGNLNLPLRGQIFLWVLVMLLVGISSLELLAATVSNRIHKAGKTSTGQR
jgi:hypothetical protein